MADERADGGSGDHRGITRRAAIGTGIAAVGVGALWASPPASALTNTPSVDELLKTLSAEISASTVRPQAKDQLLSILAQAREQLAGGHNVDCRQTLRQEFVQLLERYRGGYAISDHDADVWTSAAQRLADKLPVRDTPGAANGGKVTVFNCYNEPVNSLAVGGGVVGNVAAWSPGGASRPPEYTPASLTVSRSKNPEPKYFAIGDNRLVAQWDSFTGTATIQIPSPTQGLVSLDDDLILFVAVNEVTMMTTRGYVIARSSVDRRFGR